ncbi:hypothetical protein QEJ31_02655 [Pigmentibacter sp. JX0631]|uniref:TcdA/TcdB pore-forming domain-containing protein n=1 Tax=Pigmentibacter sp. JX0631 TaxID=2976982 RepID=UPI002469383C|nr:TcdA/TcdB pore-forming domain-containing protein [Pigmentibacter sp. JX0631]WGL60502.1 hypothetical protein QEJ31_02655 [Pigmentibacter sp. JX0631]
MLEKVFFTKNKLMLSISFIFILSCEKRTQSIEDENKKELTRSFNANGSCGGLFSEKEEFFNQLSDGELYKLNFELNYLYSLSEEDIFLKYDLSKKILEHLETVKSKYKNLAENKHLLDLTKTLQDEIEINKNRIETESKYQASLFEKTYNKLIKNKDEFFLLDSLNEDESSIEILNTQNENKYYKSINDKELKNIKNFKEFIENHSNQFYRKVNHTDHFNVSQPSIGLSHAFLLKNVVDYFNSENSGQGEDDSNPTLRKVIKAQVYTNLLQLSLDVVDSGLKTAHIVEIIRSNGLNKFNIFRTFSNYTAKINTGLNFLNLAYDYFELTHSKTNAELTRYRTQFGFDSTSSAFILGGMALGETTAGIFLSGIGEIFGGLAVGFSSYAQVAGDNIDVALNNANYFRFYEEDHNKVLNSDTFVPNSNNKTISLATKYLKRNDNTYKKEQLDVVFQEIDLTKQGSYKITFGDHISYPISRHDPDAIYYHPFAPNPELITSSKVYVKFREALQLPKEKEFSLDNIQKIILPNQAQRLITYRHDMYAPWITYRYDAEMNAARKIQMNAKFIFDYSVMRGAGDKAISELKFDYQNTDIKIKLNSNNSGIHFVSPHVHDRAINKINYNFEVLAENSQKDNEFHLHLNGDTKYSIISQEKDNWHFHIDHNIINSEFLESDKKLSLTYFNKQQKNLTISFPGKKPAKIYIHDKFGITYLVNGNGVNSLTAVKVNLDYSNFSSKYELNNFINQIRRNIPNDLRYLKINNYKEYSTSSKETAFYDLQENSYIKSGTDAEDFNILGRVHSKDNLLFYSKNYIYKLNENNQINISAVKKDLLLDNLGVKISDLLNSIKTNENVISLVINEKDYAKYDKNSKQFYLYADNKIPIGESQKNPNIFYFFDKEKNKYFSIDKNYLNPSNFKITLQSGEIKLVSNIKYEWVLEPDSADSLKNLQNTKKIALLLNDIHNSANKIEEERCQNLGGSSNSMLENLKITLCKIGKDINSSNINYISTYSSQTKKTLILDDSQSSFKQIEFLTGKYLFEGTGYENWGAGDWISLNPPYTTNQKLLAFGELPNQFNPSAANNSAFLSDVRFIDSEGNILRAISGTQNSNAKNYGIEKKLEKPYATSLLGAFVYNNKQENAVYFLKKDLQYDKLDTSFNKVSQGNIADLFYMLPADEIKNIKYILKTENHLTLYKTKGKKFDGYYLIPIQEIFAKDGTHSFYYVKL